MQSVNGVQFLNTTSLSLFFGFTTCASNGAIDIVRLTSIYASL